MKIEILGTGCPKCRKTEEIVRKAVDDLGINAEIIKIEDYNEIVDRGVMMTPAVLFDGEAKIVGRVPTADELKKLLQ